MTTGSLSTWTARAAIVVLAVCPCASFAKMSAAAMEPPLYDRLGGLEPIAVVVSDFIDDLAPDTVLNANPEIDAARKHVPAPYLKYHVTAMVCQSTGGPCQYHGRVMTDANTRLNITKREWHRMVAIFEAVLVKRGVPEKETQELVDIVGSKKADIAVLLAGG